LSELFTGAAEGGVVGSVIGGGLAVIDQIATNTTNANISDIEGQAALEKQVHAENVALSTKAKDAPGVTAGGQATDEHGRKLGPSGEPQHNETNSNTRERARNKALNQGSGAVNHPNPRAGKPHFHPTDAQGNKNRGALTTITLKISLYGKSLDSYLRSSSDS